MRSQISVWRTPSSSARSRSARAARSCCRRSARCRRPPPPSSSASGCRAHVDLPAPDHDRHGLDLALPEPERDRDRCGDRSGALWIRAHPEPARGAQRRGGRGPGRRPHAGPDRAARRRRQGHHQRGCAECAAHRKQRVAAAAQAGRNDRRTVLRRGLCAGAGGRFRGDRRGHPSRDLSGRPGLQHLDGAGAGGRDSRRWAT